MVERELKPSFSISMLTRTISLPNYVTKRFCGVACDEEREICTLLLLPQGFVRTLLTPVLRLQHSH